MGYTNSALVNHTNISPFRNSPRNHPIDKITLHHMAGNLSVEACGAVFKVRQASSNYGIGSDGRVGMYVEEKDRSWCSSNRANDHRAITIEVANDGGAPSWHVSDKALAKIIEMCVDVCVRNGIKRLNFTGNANGNLTYHEMFANTNCPGPYLKSKFPWIADTVNARLGVNGGVTSKPVPAPAVKPYDRGVNVWYQFMTEDGRWLPEVHSLKDYAGNRSKGHCGLRMKVGEGSIKFRVKSNGKWSAWAENTNSYGKEITTSGYHITEIQVVFYTPGDLRPYKQARYRASNVGEDYGKWQRDDDRNSKYVGSVGNGKSAIDRFQIEIVTF